MSILQERKMRLSEIFRSSFTKRRTGNLSDLFFTYCDIDTTKEEFINLYFKHVKSYEEFEIILNEYISKAEKENYDMFEAIDHAYGILFDKALEGFKKELYVAKELNCEKVLELESNAIDLYNKELDIYIQVKAYNYYKYRNHPRNVRMYSEEKEKQLKAGISKVYYIFVNEYNMIANTEDYLTIKNMINKKTT